MIFNKRNDEDLAPTMPTERYKLGNAPTRSVIDAGLKIVGNLEGEGELQIDGQICGDIRCTRLIIGKVATVIGNIAADEIVVRGKVNGVIRGNRVILEEGAIVHSEIFQKRLTIEEGALFEGASHMREDPTDELLAVATEMKALDKAKDSCSEARRDITALQHHVEAHGEITMPAAEHVPLTAEPEIARGMIAPDINSEMQRIRTQLRERRRA